MNERALCERLLGSETDAEVLAVLKDVGYWDLPHVWRPLGDNHNNVSIVGNQQEDAISALAEKITNSTDAILINRCLEDGIDPRGKTAPKSIREAVARFFEDKSPPLRNGEGVARYWTDSMTQQELTGIAQNIYISASGGDKPSISIADQGEGQTPDNFPSTFMSLVGVKQASGYTQSQKRDIPFVQGQFGMGGSGVYAFCSHPNNFQLLISRRNPALLPPDGLERDLDWGFTVVRRNKSDTLKSSVYEYLAPVGAAPEVYGSVLSFAADKFPLMPDKSPKSMPVGVYATLVPYGTLIKLYEYDFKAPGISLGHVLRKSGLMRQLDLVLPDAALPSRMLEGRTKFKGEPRSTSNNCRGILARMEALAARQGVYDDDADDLDVLATELKTTHLGLEGPPLYGALIVRGIEVPYAWFVFNGDAGDLTRGGRSNLIFSVNGQKHAVKDRNFLSQKRVNRKWLSRQNAFLGVIDCSNFTPIQREDLFMSSRDRMKDSSLSTELETQLAEALHSSEELRRLEAQQYERHAQERLQDRAPVRNVLKNLLKASPNLARFFKIGPHVTSPFGGGTLGGDKADFVGRPDPTFFRFKGGNQERLQVAHLGAKSRIVFETDADNHYFSRSRDTGRFFQQYINAAVPVTGQRGNLKDGTLTFTLDLPSSAAVGDVLELEFAVTDDTRTEPFICRAKVRVEAPVHVGPGGSGKRNTKTSGEGGSGGQQNVDDLLILRYVVANPVPGQTDLWPEGWNEKVAVRIEIAPETEAITFQVNVDNRDLKFLQKESRGADPRMLEERYVYSLVLLALSLIQDAKNREASAPDPTDNGDEAPEVEIEDVVAQVTDALSPMVLPMMDAVGSMTTDMLAEL